MLCLQVDILHPLTTLKWYPYRCVPREVRFDSTKFVALGEKIYIHVSSGTHLYVSTDLNSWTVLSKLPVPCGTLTTYRSQLVLVGGIQIVSELLYTTHHPKLFEDTAGNKLWSLSEAGVWQESLPPMPTKRFEPVVVSATDPECLIVIGGNIEYEQSIEVLIGDQWFVAEHPPSDSLEGGVVHNGMLYVHERGRDAQIFCCDFQSLIASCRRPDPNNPLKWSKIKVMHDSAINVLSFGQQLVMVRKNEMFAYQPLTDEMPWVSLGHIPIPKGVALSTFLHAGGLLVTYSYQQQFFQIMRLSLISKCSA